MPTREPPAAAPSADEAILALARAVMVEANRARRAEGVRELESSGTLDRAAMRYAEELAQRRTLSHASPTAGRQTLTQRIEAEGGSWVRAAENLANMSRPVDLARTTIRMWLESNGHRANLLDDGFTHSGVGVAADVRGNWYVVQVYTVPGRAR